MARPISIQGKTTLPPATPAHSVQRHLSYRPGLSPEDSLKLDICDLQDRLRALGETDIPSLPKPMSLSSSIMATSPPFPVLAFSPPSQRKGGGPTNFPGSPRSLPFSSPPAADASGIPPQPLSFSLLHHTGHPQSPPLVPQPFFGQPYGNLAGTSARPKELDLKQVKGFDAAGVTAPTLSLASEGPALYQRSRSTTYGGGESWPCAGCEAEHDAEEEAAITVLPCRTLACCRSLRLRLLNGGRSRCPACLGPNSHLLSRAVANAVLSASEVKAWIAKEKRLDEHGDSLATAPSFLISHILASSTRSTPSPPAKLKPLAKLDTPRKERGQRGSASTGGLSPRSSRSPRSADLASASSDAGGPSSDYGAEAVLSSDDSLDEAEPPTKAGETRTGEATTEGLHLLVNGGAQAQNRLADVLVEKRPPTPQYASWDVRKTRFGNALAGGSTLNAPSGPTSRRKNSSNQGQRRRPLSPVPGSGARSASPAVIQEEAPPLFKWRLFIRFELIPEVGLLTLLLGFGAYRLRYPHQEASSPALQAHLPPVPMAPLLVLLVLLPLTTLLRRWPRRYLHYPFTDERGYRDATQADDGLAIGIAVPVLLSTSSLSSCLNATRASDVYLEGIRPLPDIWDAQKLDTRWLHRRHTSQDIFNSVLHARTSLYLLTLCNAYILLFNLLLARTIFKIAYLPQNNTKRFFGVAFLSAIVSGGLVLLLLGMEVLYGPSPYVQPSEVAAGTFLYQMSMYSISRLVRRGFTLGELSVASAAGIALALEFARLTWARWHWTTQTTVPQLFRAPTPLVAYQHVLIPGAFLCGFILSPLLVLSRHIASKPMRRLRWPQHKERNRRLLAAGVAVGLASVVALLLSPWVSWTMGGGYRFAWSWASRYLIFGGDGVQGMHRGELHGWARWHRLAISLYWLAVISGAVGGWTGRIVRTRRIHMTQQSSAPVSPGIKVGVEAAREEKRKHVSLDLRRKFFHALAVVMFVPGIVLDPAFTSLAFSVAFAIFTFAEYARYFALYPIGGPIHVFFHEFTDAKDAGPVILSHFYLLTGCAGGLWLEGKGIKRYTGVFALGFGDALASIIGRRVGGPKWSAASPKTIVGSVAFVVSVICAAGLLRWSGFVEPYSRSRYLLATCIAATMEAVSTQNDNLTVPLIMWSVSSLLRV